MRTFTLVVLVGASLAAAPAAQTSERSGRPSDAIERPFESGGRVRMKLSAGGYEIIGTSENRMRLEWRVRDPERLWRVKARADIEGSRATIETDGPDNSGFHVTIRVPTRTDLNIDLSAGKLRIEGIDGNKDIDLYAGEVNVDVRRAADYKIVDASVWAGEIDARPFNASKGGLFRSVGWTGPGSYRLRVGLWAGEIRLYTTDSAASR
jgi:hypothetical protein